MFLGKAAAGGTSCLNGLELLAALDAASDVVDDLAEGRTHRHLDEAHVVDLAGQGEHLGSLGLLGTDGSEPLGTLEEDYGDVGEGLYVVDVGGLAEIAADCGERRLHGRLAPLALHRVDKGGLLTADEGSGSVAYFYVEIESRAEDVVSQQTVVAGLLHGYLETLHGQGILGADVHQTLGGSDTVAADGHGLDYRVGVALEDGTVHERAGVALVGVADHVLLLAGALGGYLPLETGGESSAAASSQTGLLDGLYGLLGSALEHLGQSLVAVAGYVLVDILGIDESAVTQSDTELLLIEAHVLRVADMLLGVGVLVEQTGDLAALDHMLLDDLLGVLRLHIGVESVVGNHLHDGTLLAETEAARHHHLHVIVHPRSGDLLPQPLDDPHALGRTAARTSAAQ